MKLHQLTNTTKRPNRKRVGRGDGNGLGSTCGRGCKGAGQRTGHTSRPHFEGGQMPLFRRLPKRGFDNPNHVTYTLINLRNIEKNFETGAVIDLQVLAAASLVNVKPKDTGLKVLGDGEISKAVTIVATKFSASAKAKIEAAGGTCQLA
jgi:large subunit ribosomal protein L15